MSQTDVHFISLTLGTCYTRLVTIMYCVIVQQIDAKSCITPQFIFLQILLFLFSAFFNKNSYVIKENLFNIYIYINLHN